MKTMNSRFMQYSTKNIDRTTHSINRLRVSCKIYKKDFWLYYDCSVV